MWNWSSAACAWGSLPASDGWRQRSNCCMAHSAAPLCKAWRPAKAAQAAQTTEPVRRIGRGASPESSIRRNSSRNVTNNTDNAMAGPKRGRGEERTKQGGRQRWVLTGHIPGLLNRVEPGQFKPLQGLCMDARELSASRSQRVSGPGSSGASGSRRLCSSTRTTMGLWVSASSRGSET